MGAKIIAIGNLKGGTGKSTLAVNLACALGSAAKTRAVLVDADSQGTAVEWAARGRLPVAVEAMPFEPEADGDGAWLKALNGLAAQNDFVVVDLPPHLGTSIVLALVAADLLVVPVTPSGADIKATTKAIDLLRQARGVRGNGKPGCLLVPSRVDRRTAAGKEIEAVLHDFGEPVAPAVGQRSAHVDAFTAGEWIGTYAPRTSAHDEIQTLTAIIRRSKA
ncbi:ParA family protein [Azospirillum sp. TSO22-1]|uniref:ParA family protein n=1 Tax=Azospirillum sp. TSO22-1 TaxID=716789 RepID=UPI000D643F71|nr:ParA family protein [Azospirillum sp. TSO22-1]